MKVKFFTLGCKVNQYETQALIEEFKKEGVEVTAGAADLYIVNTCSVTHRADTKSKEMLRKLKRNNPQAKVAAIGCCAQSHDTILKNLKLDYIIPQDKKQYLLETVFNKPYHNSKNPWSLKISEFFNHRAFVKIQDGCDNFCSFCKIPSLRGRPVSRPQQEILDEIERLTPRHKEIVLCGTNIALYGKDVSLKKDLTSLIKHIISINNVARIRLSSLQPRYITEELLALFENPKMCTHLHFPFQSGDDKILKDMNKRETASLYLDIVGKARQIMPDIAISCDIMVGFPTEDGRSFDTTVRFLEKVQPMRMHIFRFSPRPGTLFENVKIANSGTIKKRYTVLKRLGQAFSQEYNSKFIGKVLYMIAEERKGNYTSGYTENYITIHVKERVPLGTLVGVRPHEVKEGKVYGKIAE
jgi:threonylcarbamoyladenosine tRNA methylthiotransferase MtaB